MTTFLYLILCAMSTAAGTDMVLPATPLFATVFNISSEISQRILSIYVAGNACGLLLFGNLADRFSKIRMLFFALLLFSLTSFGCAYAPEITLLLILRFIQGMASAAASVFIPGFIRGLFPHRKAARAIGLLGSIQALIPAIAPVVGTLILQFFNWRITFISLGVLTMALAVMIRFAKGPERNPGQRTPGTYVQLLKNAVYLRYALSQALAVGGLITFVFGAPSVIILSMGGNLNDFILMQMLNVGGYIIAANISPGLAERFSHEKVILAGTLMALLSAFALSGYGFLNGSRAFVMTILFTPMGFALGLRGPVAFYRGIVSAGSNDARGSALMIFLTFITTALGSLITGHFITGGLTPLAMSVTAMFLLSFLLFVLLPKLNRQ
ncbi:MFS transporter [Enterobacter ludwigii]|uniref:MFS transporter n=1 Tax=Enterobacter ludwigii TaxID=299767 RepID=UPI00110AAABE|nr:MFS transporter [Enterobacter ludwigii]MDP9943603.1 putative MFS family arabinose efflux permease [Enterobacter ludwigii]QCV80321.1 multidrug effflux MFS transporter [Enterobacter ludwigii]QDE50496.1 multidrug effflux MFS transporter [Enterobacter ludwigii]